jgi:parallel beta-helix repeat protein
MRNALILTSTLLCVSLATRAAEVHTNGLGGGAWSEVATWRTGALPKPEDSVVIAAGDTVVFDLADANDGKLACKDMYIDPNGALTFKSGAKRTLIVEGPIESYGVVKVDASGSADDFIEIRFAAKAMEQRNLKLVKGGAFMATGRPELPDGKRNIVISSKPPPPPAPATPDAPPTPPLPMAQTWGYIDGVAGTSIDAQYVQFDGVTIRGNTIDNTGAKPNERLNIAACVFTNGASISLDVCDTPTIIDNKLEYTGDSNPNGAIRVSSCSLAEIKGNTVSGPYPYGIIGAAMADSVVADNVITKTNMGIYWYGANGMLKNNTVRECVTGIQVTSMSGAMEDTTFEKCKNGLDVAGAVLQATNLRFVDVPEDGVRVHFTNGPLTLVNCDLTPEQIKITPSSPVPNPPKPRVESLQYCLVQVKGAMPRDAGVEMTTANPPAPIAKGALDPNVRNSPATLSPGGYSPLPQTLTPLMVKTWSIGPDGKPIASPNYNITITAPGDKPEDEPKKVKTVTVTPDAKWYRAKPNDPIPTVEVTLP